MAALFLVMLVVAQIAFLVVARTSVGASVDAAVRDAAREPAALEHHRQALSERVATLLPGASLSDVAVHQRADTVIARVAFRWVPPGPDLIPITIVVEAERSIVVPP